MALCIQVLVKRVYLSAGGIVGDRSHRALPGDCFAERIGIVGGTRHDNFGGEAFDQAVGFGQSPRWPPVSIKRTGYSWQGARVVAQRVRQPFEFLEWRASHRVRARTCPLDLHALAPVPVPVLQR